MKSILDYIKVFKNIETYKGPAPRNMAEGGVIGKPGGIVEPGVKYYGTSKVYNEKTGHIYPGGNVHGKWWSDKPGKNQQKISLKDIKVKEKVKTFIIDNPDMNQKEGSKILGKKQAELVPADQWGNPGKKRKVDPTEAQKKARAKKIATSSESMLAEMAGKKGLNLSHLSLTQLDSLQNLGYLPKDINIKSYHSFEKKIIANANEIYAAQNNKSLSIPERRAKIAELQKIDRALRKKFPKYSNIKARLKVQATKLDPSGVMIKEIIDPKIAISQEAGTTLKGVTPATEKGQDLLKLSKKSLTETLNWNKVINNSKAKITAKALESAGVTDICSTQLVKKAGGGRIGFAKKVCGTKFAEQNPDGFMKAAAKSEDAADLFKSGNIAKHLMKAKNWAKSNMGPAGWIGGELLIVGLGSVWDMSQGKGWKEALDNWTGLGGHFGQAEKRLKEIGIEQGYSEQEINDAMKIGQLMDLSTEAEGKQWELDQIQEAQDIGGTAKYKSDSKRRFVRPKEYVRGEYQDPKRIRDLKTKLPKMWKEGTELYESLKDFDFSAGLYDELQQKKKREEYDRMIELRSKPRHYSQQFDVSAAPEFEPWTPYAGGGMVGDKSGPPPESGPMSQGLRSLYNNVRKR